MKQLSIFILAVLLTGVLAAGCNNHHTVSGATQNNSAGQLDLKAMKKVIEEKNNRFTRAHLTGDTATIDNMFTEDARSFPPNAEAAVGRPAIARLTTDFLTYGLKEFSETSTALYGNNDYLVDEGTYYMTYGKDSTVEKGKYINVWKNINGDWKIYSNIWNTNTPATP